MFVPFILDVYVSGLLAPLFPINKMYSGTVAHMSMFYHVVLFCVFLLCIVSKEKVMLENCGMFRLT